jgi:hypothetical protein
MWLHGDVEAISKESIVSNLKEGNDIMLSPGGTREMMNPEWNEEERADCYSGRKGLNKSLLVSETRIVFSWIPEHMNLYNNFMHPASRSIYNSTHVPVVLLINKSGFPLANQPDKDVEIILDGGRVFKTPQDIQDTFLHLLESMRES